MNSKRKAMDEQLEGPWPGVVPAAECCLSPIMDLGAQGASKRVAHSTPFRAVHGLRHTSGCSHMLRLLSLDLRGMHCVGAPQRTDVLGVLHSSHNFSPEQHHLRCRISFHSDAVRKRKANDCCDDASVSIETPLISSRQQ